MEGMIFIAGAMVSMAIILSIPNGHDYHTDLRNIAYQLSRIADTLDRRAKNEANRR